MSALLEKSTILTNLTSDRITREREYHPICLRDDRKDVLAQTMATIEQMLSDGISGKIIVSVSNGGISDIVVKESQKVPENNS